jgi:hypothetical protein
MRFKGCLAGRLFSNQFTADTQRVPNYWMEFSDQIDGVKSSLHCGVVQGDQIGLIFAQRVNVYFGQVFFKLPN